MANITWIVRDGALLSLAATLFLIFIVRLNPRIMLQDYPADIKAKAPPKTPAEKKLSLALGIPFMLLLVGAPVLSTLIFKQHSAEPVTFWALFLNAFGVAFIFNLVDWLIIDWLLFCTITPRFIVIPGTEGMAGYKNYYFHFRGFLTGTVFSALCGLIAAAVVWFL